MRRACRPSPAWPRWALVVCAATAVGFVRPATAQNCASPSFGTIVSAPVTDSPWAVVQGDFHGAGGIPDGDLDVVVARDGVTATVALYEGTGGADLTFVDEYSVGSGPRDVVAADFDLDGLLDIAVASETAMNVGILRGTGDSFGAVNLMTVGGAPVRLAVADFNRDGRPDLAVVRSGSAGIRILLGNGDLTFTAFGTDRPLTDATAAVAGDFNGDGTPDLAVTQGSQDQVAIFLGRGDGFLGTPGLPSWSPNPLVTVEVGDEPPTVIDDPVDIATADVDDDGDLDLVTANSLNDGTVTILRGDGTGLFPDRELRVNPAGLVEPVRVALADIDRDGLVDLVALDAGSAPGQIMVLRGTGDWRPPLPPTPRTFDDAHPFPQALSSLPRDLTVDDVAVNGRLDFVVVEEELPSSSTVAVVPNSSGPDCPRTSFGDAPRAFPGGDSPWAVAVADFDEDGLEDLVTANADLAELSFLRGTGNGYLPPVSLGGLLVRARGLATADFDFDGHADLVAALGDGIATPGNGTEGRIHVFRGDGMGGFTTMALLADGDSMTAVVVGDFDGDGGPDIAATSDETDQLYVFLGNGSGGFAAAPSSPLAVGVDPSALAVGTIDGGMVPDIAVANYGSNNVSVFPGNGDGTFGTRVDVPVGVRPWSVAVGLVDDDLQTDIVTANYSGGDVSLVFAKASGGFDPPVSHAGVGVPIAVAVLDATQDGPPDVLVATSSHTLVLLEGPYVTSPTAGFQSEDTFAVRQRPSQMVPVDADADGTRDLVIPCKDSGDVVVLLARPPGPPAFLVAERVSVGTTPEEAAAGDFDRDGDVDLAVVNSGSDSVSILANDGNGVFIAGSPIPVNTMPVAIVATDLDLDGILDLAVSCSGAGEVVFLQGDGALGFSPTLVTSSIAIAQPDDLVSGDFDGDGDPDLAVLSKSTVNAVYIIANERASGLAISGMHPVGEGPTGIFTADFTGNGVLDLAVANDNLNSDNLSVLIGDGTGDFALPATLGLDGDTSPVSVTGGDFDRDGDVDLATVAFGGHRLILFENDGGFPSTPSLKLDAPREPSFVTTADINRDGIPDLALAASGLKAVRSKPAPGLAFENGEDFLAGVGTFAVVPADFNRDGLPDFAVVNRDSDDVSILLSTACVRRRLVVSTSPNACTPGPSPFPVQAIVQVQDDGGNLLQCESESVNASIAPGTGSGGTLGGTTSVAVTGGVADFDALSIDSGGVRYRLKFDLSGVPPVLSRSFSLDPLPVILGPTSVCPATSETYTASESLDSYVWTLNPAAPGFPSFTPSTTLVHSELTPPDTLYTLGLQGRVDGCAPADSLDVYVGNLFLVTIDSPGPFAACVDCFGGTFTSTETGGGVPTARQWGYRTVSLGAITPIPGETGGTYVFKGTDFPGPGTYYLVETTTPAAGCGGPMMSNEIRVDVMAPVPGGETQSLGVLSRGSSSVGENVLQWVNPNGVQQVLIRWNKAPDGTSTCTSPVDPFVTPVSGEHTIPYAGPTTRGQYPHGGLKPDTAYCYSVFAMTGGSYAPGRIVKARPFDTAGPVKWAYATGATAVQPPTVAQAGIIALSNDRTPHSLIRGIINGGIWPTAYTPDKITGVVNSRSPVVPLSSAVGGADALLFVGDDTGDVFAIDAAKGNKVWGPVKPASDSKITGAPGAMLHQYGGPLKDVVVVGTRDDVNGAGALHTLDLATGAPIDSFDGGNTMGPVVGTPVVDYANDRVYVASFSRGPAGPSLWCVDIDDTGMMSECQLPWMAPDLGDILTSPVLRNRRLYVSNSTDVYSVDADTGSPGSPLSTGGDGAAKGFLWPDRRKDGLHDNALYFATNSMVRSVTDAGGALSTNWTWNAGGTLEPNVLLQWPGTNLLYVGSQGGQLYELDFTDATLTTPPAVASVVLGDGLDHIGAPSLDIGVEPPDVGVGKKLLIVGSESGVLYAIEVSLAP